jgi:hypothetical protein
MLFLLRGWLVVGLTLSCVVTLWAQEARAPAHRDIPWQQYCQPGNSFCFRYPATWSVLGEIFEGNGVVVAPEQKEDRALWDEVTVALIVPPPQAGEDPVSIDQLIERTMVSLHEEGQSVVTLRRQQRSVDGQPAQLLKVGYHQKTNDHDWIEQLAFIEGPQSEIYSVALKCSPLTLATLEPVFNEMLESWKLPEPAPPANPGAEEKAQESSPPSKSAPKSQPQNQAPKN